MTDLVLCIGAPRSGTTWLYSNIRKTENIFVPCVKEVRFFLGARSPEGVRTTYENRVNEYTSEEDSIFLEKWLSVQTGDTAAYLDAMLNTSRKKIAMDISPIYCIASQKQVQKIRKVVGDNTKILYFLRNPVDREYSQANLHFHMHGSWKTETAPLANYLELLQEGSQVRRSDYLNVLDTWTKNFGEDNVHTVFYDDLRSNPALTFEKVLKFLEVNETGLVNDPSVENKVGSSFDDAHIRAPKELKTLIAASKLSTLKEMANRFPEPCQLWYDEALELVNGLEQKTYRLSA